MPTTLRTEGMGRQQFVVRSERSSSTMCSGMRVEARLISLARVSSCGILRDQVAVPEGTTQQIFYEEEIMGCFSMEECYGGERAGAYGSNTSRFARVATDATLFPASGKLGNE